MRQGLEGKRRAPAGIGCLVTGLIHLILISEFSGRLFSVSIARRKSSSSICVQIGKYSMSVGKALLWKETVGPSLFVSAVLLNGFLSQVASESLSSSTRSPSLWKEVTALMSPGGVVSSLMLLRVSLIVLTISLWVVLGGYMLPPGRGSRII